MEEQKPQRISGIPFWGLFLLFLGTVFLLQTIHVLPWGLWRILWRFWPVLLIAAGTGIILRRTNTWLVSLLILALLFGSLGIAIWQYEPPNPPSPLAGSSTQSLDTLKKAHLDIEFTAGNLNIASLAADSQNLLESDSRFDFRTQNSAGMVSLSRKGDGWPFWDEGKDSWHVDLSRKLPFTANVNTNFSNVILKLNELQITRLAVDSDLSNYTMELPHPRGTLSVFIKADLSTLNITIPEGVAAKVTVTSDLSSMNINETRFPGRGNTYLSPNFESAADRIELEIDCDLSVVEVE